MIAELADAGLPPLRGHQFFSTQFDFVPVAMIVAALVLYLWGVRRNNALHPRHPWSNAKTAAWIGALATTGVAVFSFVGVYDGELFWDHMVQHLILIMVAAPLYAIASPLELTWRATRGTPHLVVTEALRSPVAKFFGHPVVGFCLYAVLIPLSHLTSWYNLTLEHESIHNAEHLAFLVVGYLFWRQIFGNDPNRYRLHPALQFFYLFLAIPIDTFTGLSLAGETHEIFPAYWPCTDLGPLLGQRPARRRRHHVGGRRHPHALAHDPRRAALDAHGRAQRRTRRPRAGRAAIGRGAGARTGARSAAEVHQLHPHPVGVGAVDELECRPAEVERGAAGLDHGTPQLDDPSHGGRDVLHAEGQMGEPELVDGPPLTRAEGCRIAEGEQLDGRRARGG